MRFLAVRAAKIWVLERSVFQIIMMKTGLEKMEERVKFLSRYANSFFQIIVSSQGISLVLKSLVSIFRIKSITFSCARQVKESWSKKCIVCSSLRRSCLCRDILSTRSIGLLRVIVHSLLRPYSRYDRSFPHERFRTFKQKLKKTKLLENVHIFILFRGVVEAQRTRNLVTALSAYRILNIGMQLPTN